MDPIILSCVLGVIVAFYVYLVRKYNFWERNGVPYVKGIIPGLGNNAPLIFSKVDVPTFYDRIYKSYKNASVIGFYDMLTPVLLVREPELVKQVLQTNFSSFHENGLLLDPEQDPLLTKNPFFSTGEVWMNSRKRLTYAFSSMRLRILSEAVRVVCEKFENYIDRHLKETGRMEIELKNLFTRFTGEVVASAGFGVEGMCFEDRPTGKTFRHIGDNIFGDDKMRLLRIMHVIPILGKLLQRGFISMEVDKFFRDLVRELWEARKKETERRNDFLQVMLDMQKSEGVEIDIETVAASALSFFVDGYETSAATASFVGFMLSRHPEIQEKLRQEITSVLEKHNGTINYDSLKEMTYLEQVINESQRIYPVLPMLNKKCTNEFELRGSDGLSVKMKPGMYVHIPLANLHMDPKYWADPEIFDPDRFSEERKSEIQKCTFIPFGDGPRMCVGMRMGLLQVKASIALLIKKYKLKPSSKTQLPMRMKTSVINTPVHGVWAIIEPL